MSSMQYTGVAQLLSVALLGDEFAIAMLAGAGAM